jgi:predicted nucleic acid-binding Zn ribbon protein
MTNSGFETPVRYNNITPITIDEFCFTEMKVLTDNKRNKRTVFCMWLVIIIIVDGFLHGNI